MTIIFLLSSEMADFKGGSIPIIGTEKVLRISSIATLVAVLQARTIAEILFSSHCCSQIDLILSITTSGDFSPYGQKALSITKTKSQPTSRQLYISDSPPIPLSITKTQGLFFTTNYMKKVSNLPAYSSFSTSQTALATHSEIRAVKRSAFVCIESI